MNLIDVKPSSDTTCGLCFSHAHESNNNWAAHINQAGVIHHPFHVECWELLLRRRLNCPMCIQPVNPKPLLYKNIFLFNFEASLAGASLSTCAFHAYKVVFTVAPLIYEHGFDKIVGGFARRASANFHTLPSKLINFEGIIIALPLYLGLIGFAGLRGFNYMIPKITEQTRRVQPENCIYLNYANFLAFFNAFIPNFYIMLCLNDVPMSHQIVAAVGCCAVYGYVHNLTYCGENKKNLITIFEVTLTLFVGYTLANLTYFALPNQRINRWLDATVITNMVIPAHFISRFFGLDIPLNRQLQKIVTKLV